MKCFIHEQQEAIAVCEKCGKGMCGECSAYSAHSGICPECRRKDFIEEKKAKYNLLGCVKSDIRWNTFKMIALSWTVIGLFYFLYQRSVSIKEKNELETRINWLDKEISRLGKALGNKGQYVL